MTLIYGVDILQNKCLIFLTTNILGLANKRIHKITNIISKGIKQRRKDITYGNICVHADLGENSNDFVTHIRIGRAKD